MSFAIGLLSLAATLLNPAELGLIDAPGLELQIRKQLKVAQGDALFVRATVDGVPVHGFRSSCDARRRASGCLSVPRAPLHALTAWGAGRCRQSRHGKRREEAPPVSYDDAAQAGDTAQPTAWLVRDEGLLPVSSFIKRRPFRFGVMRASSMRSAAPS